jgi:hypothetical protein
MYSLLHAVARSKVEELKFDDNQWELNDWEELTFLGQSVITCSS